MCRGLIFMPFVLGLLVGLLPAAAAPLHEAAKAGQLETVKQLLAEGADIEARDNTGNTAGETPLTLAALAGEAEAVELLIGLGAAVDGRSIRGSTALHAAAYGGHLDIVGLLLENGAAINDGGNKSKTTPLHMAAEENHLEVAQKLILSGAEIEPMNLNHFTPASMAAFKPHEEMLILLRLHGAGCQSELLMGLKYRLYCLGRGG